MRSTIFFLLLFFFVQDSWSIGSGEDEREEDLETTELDMEEVMWEGNDDDDEDYNNATSSDIDIINENVTTNCFSLATTQRAWQRLLSYNVTSYTLAVRVTPSQLVTQCLLRQEQDARGSYYRLQLSTGDQQQQQQQATPMRLLSDTVEFRDLVTDSPPSVRFQLCQATTSSCDDTSAVTSSQVVASSPKCDHWSSNHNVSVDTSVTFQFFNNHRSDPDECSFTVTLHKTSNISSSVTCGDQDDDDDSGNSDQQVESRRGIRMDENDSSVTYRTQQLQGNEYYCLLVTNDCSNNNNNCTLSSPWVYVDSLPEVSKVIPYCTSHFRCAWIYLTIAGSAVLTLSCLLSVCFLHCCCCCRRNRKNKLRHLAQDELIPFEGLETGGTAAITPRKTWVELHNEWDTEPPKNPGKILLLYSPDTQLFKELQTAFKGFLELACHCVVLDLFDEELFQSIAFDPELWLSNLLQDDDFKIIVICSQGAYKRQEALLSGEVLNIPDNSTMDGLFSAGLRFIQEQHAYDYNRLALARYEMLSLTAPEFRLQEMVPNREFLVPTQLHDLFCWIHGYDPLDLLGKPWDRYHLEWQLLTEALKQTRLRDGRRGSEKR